MSILFIFTDSLSFVTPGAAPYQTLSLQSTNSADVTKNGHQRARVLYDYDAKDATELSLMADEVTQSHQLPYILESNPHPFYSFRGPKNQVRITVACRLDSRSRAGFWKNDGAAVHAIRTIQYNNLLFYLLLIIYYSSDSLSSFITESLSILRQDCVRLLRKTCFMVPV
jgi:hypothetical protein